MTSATILSIQYQREDIKGRIDCLRARHRKRKALQKIFCALTTKQIKLQNRQERMT